MDLFNMDNLLRNNRTFNYRMNLRNLQIPRERQVIGDQYESGYIIDFSSKHSFQQLFMSFSDHEFSTSAYNIPKYFSLSINRRSRTEYNRDLRNDEEYEKKIKKKIEMNNEKIKKDVREAYGVNVRDYGEVKELKGKIFEEIFGFEDHHKTFHLNQFVKLENEGLAEFIDRVFEVEFKIETLDEFCDFLKKDIDNYDKVIIAVAGIVDYFSDSFNQKIRNFLFDNEKILKKIFLKIEKFEIPGDPNRTLIEDQRLIEGVISILSDLLDYSHFKKKEIKFLKKIKKDLFLKFYKKCLERKHWLEIERMSELFTIISELQKCFIFRDFNSLTPQISLINTEYKSVIFKLTKSKKIEFLNKIILKNIFSQEYIFKSKKAASDSSEDEEPDMRDIEYQEDYYYRFIEIIQNLTFFFEFPLEHKVSKSSNNQIPGYRFGGRYIPPTYHKKSIKGYYKEMQISERFLKKLIGIATLSDSLSSIKINLKRPMIFLKCLRAGKFSKMGGEQQARFIHDFSFDFDLLNSLNYDDMKPGAVLDLIEKFDFDVSILMCHGLDFRHHFCKIFESEKLYERFLSILFKRIADEFYDLEELFRKIPNFKVVISCITGNNAFDILDLEKLKKTDFIPYFEIEKIFEKNEENEEINLEDYLMENGLHIDWNSKDLTNCLFEVYDSFQIKATEHRITQFEKIRRVEIQNILRNAGRIHEQIERLNFPIKTEITFFNFLKNSGWSLKSKSDYFFKKTPENLNSLIKLGIVILVKKSEIMPLNYNLKVEKYYFKEDNKEWDFIDLRSEINNQDYSNLLGKNLVFSSFISKREMGKQNINILEPSEQGQYDVLVERRTRKIILKGNLSSLIKNDVIQTNINQDRYRRAKIDDVRKEIKGRNILVDQTRAIEDLCVKTNDRFDEGLFLPEIRKNQVRIFFNFTRRKIEKIILSHQEQTSYTVFKAFRNKIIFEGRKYIQEYDKNFQEKIYLKKNFDFNKKLSKKIEEVINLKHGITLKMKGYRFKLNYSNFKKLIQQEKIIEEIEITNKNSRGKKFIYKVKPDTEVKKDPHLNYLYLITPKPKIFKIALIDLNKLADDILKKTSHENESQIFEEFF